MESSFNEKQWVLLSHLSAFGGFIFPLGNILGPLLIWLLKKEKSSAVEAHAREALNFQISISISIYILISSVLIIVGIGLVLVPILVVVQVVLIILAALAADRGEFYTYPITIRFIK